MIHKTEVELDHEDITSAVKAFVRERLNLAVRATEIVVEIPVKDENGNLTWRATVARVSIKTGSAE